MHCAFIEMSPCVILHRSIMYRELKVVYIVRPDSIDTNWLVQLFPRTRCHIFTKDRSPVQCSINSSVHINTQRRLHGCFCSHSWLQNRAPLRDHTLFPKKVMLIKKMSVLKHNKMCFLIRNVILNITCRIKFLYTDLYTDFSTDF